MPYKKIKKEFSPDIKILNLMNKEDLLTPDQYIEAGRRAQQIAPEEKYFLVSALNNTNIGVAKNSIIEMCRENKNYKTTPKNTVAISGSSVSHDNKKTCC